MGRRRYQVFPLKGHVLGYAFLEGVVGMGPACLASRRDFINQQWRHYTISSSQKCQFGHRISSPEALRRTLNEVLMLDNFSFRAACYAGVALGVFWIYVATFADALPTP